MDADIILPRCYIIRCRYCNEPMKPWVNVSTEKTLMLCNCQGIDHTVLVRWEDENITKENI